MITEGPDYGAHFCTAVQCASRKAVAGLLRLAASDSSSLGAKVVANKIAMLISVSNKLEVLSG